MRRMRKGILIAVLLGILTFVLATPAFAQTPLPNPPFNQPRCLELGSQGPFEWDPPTTKCVVSPPVR